MSQAGVRGCSARVSSHTVIYIYTHTHTLWIWFWSFFIYCFVKKRNFSAGWAEPIPSSDKRKRASSARARYPSNTSPSSGLHKKSRARADSVSLGSARFTPLWASAYVGTCAYIHKVAKNREIIYMLISNGTKLRGKQRFNHAFPYMTVKIAASTKED